MKICVDFQKLDTATKKDIYPFPFMDEVINIVVGHEVYTFLDEFVVFYQISITLDDQHKTTLVTNLGDFVWVVMPFGVKNGSPIY